MRVALVHDWLTGMRGGERVLERIAGMFPDAPIHTLVWKRGAVSAAIESHPIRTSFLQRIPDAERRYRWLLPLYPRAIESLDLSGVDLVISTSHAAAKSAIAPPGAFHLSYVFTPMRYVWDLEHEYFPPGRFPWPLSAYVRSTCARLRAWDAATSTRPHVVLADSAAVAERIRRHWGRDAEVVYPPVEIERFTAGHGPRGYYLLAGAFAPYKRGELALDACRRLGRKVIVVGSGPRETALRAIAPADAEFRGWVSDTEMAGLYAGARALLFPGEEDFGIVPVEAMASGCPVIAYAKGGALETVGRGASAADLVRASAGETVPVPGGVLFGDRSADGMAAAIRDFEARAFDPDALRERTRPFAPECFEHGFRGALDRGLAAFRSQLP